MGGSVRHGAGGGGWEKWYPPGRAADALGEARVLAAAAHPGVVELRGLDEGADGGVTLRMTAVPAPRLADLAPTLSAQHFLGLVAAVATTVGDLHHLGICHRAISADHVLVDGAGRPVLCGFGSATVADGAAGRGADVEAVLGLLDASSAVSSLVTDRQRRQLGRCRSAEELAAAVVRIFPCASLPDPAAGDAPEPAPAEPPTPAQLPPGDRPGPGRRRRTGLLVAAGVAIVAATATVVASAGERPSPPRPIPATTPPMATTSATASPTRPEAASPSHPAPQTLPSGSPIACPRVDQGCGPIPGAGTLLVTGGGRYSLGSATDVVVLGRWTCGAALPAVLQPASGRVWAFRALAPAHPGAVVAATAVTLAPAARSLRVLPGRRCDRLVVVEGGGRVVAVTVVGSP